MGVRLRREQDGAYRRAFAVHVRRGRRGSPGATHSRRAFDESWDAYRAWYLQAGDAARPSYVECRAAIRTHMPELVATYERLVELAGGGDLAARMLSLWCPPSYLVRLLAGGPVPRTPRCSFATTTTTRSARRRDRPAELTGRRVIGMSDCLWGLLDGDQRRRAGRVAHVRRPPRDRPGLRHPTGRPLPARDCATWTEAAATIRRLPVQMAYNVTMIDAAGRTASPRSSGRAGRPRCGRWR